MKAIKPDYDPEVRAAQRPTQWRRHPSPVTAASALCFHLCPTNPSSQSQFPVYPPCISFAKVTRHISIFSNLSYTKSIILDTLLSFAFVIWHYVLGLPSAVGWLRLCASNAGGAGLIPVQGTRIPHATENNQKLQNRNENNKKDSCPGQHSAPAPLTLRKDHYCVVWTCHSLFNHSPICGQLGSSQHCGITMPQWRTMFSIYFQSAGGVSSRPILIRETAQFESSRPGLWGTAKSDSTSSVSQCLSLHGLVNRRCYKNLYQSKKWEMVTCCWVIFIPFFGLPSNHVSFPIVPSIWSSVPQFDLLSLNF